MKNMFGKILFVAFIATIGITLFSSCGKRHKYIYITAPCDTVQAPPPPPCGDDDHHKH